MADTITTTSSQAPEWLQPYLKSYMDRAFSVADTPYQQYQGQRVADLNGTQQTAMDAIQNRAMNGNPVMNAAQGALQGIAGGQGLGAQAASNPYLTQQNANANAFNPYANVQNTAAGAANPYLNATNANANTFNPYANVSNAAAGASNPYLNATNASANTFNPYANATNAAAGAQNQNINAYNSQAGAANPYLNVQNPLAQAENPYLQQQIDAASSDTMRNYSQVVRPQMDAAMAQSGSFGNSGLQQVQANQQTDLGKQLGNISSGMRMQDYTQRQGLQENATNRLYQGGQTLQGQQYGAGQQLAQNQFQGGAQFQNQQFSAGQQQAQNLYGAGQQQAQNIYGAGQQQAQNQYLGGAQLQNQQFNAGQQQAQNLYGAGQQQAQNLYGAGQQQAQNQYLGGATLQNQQFNAGSQAAQNLYGAGQQQSQNQFNAGSQYANQLFTGGQAQASAQNQMFQNQQANQMQALSMAPQYAAQDYTDAGQLMNIGNTLQNQQQAGLNADYGNWQTAQQYPQQQLGILGQSLGMNYGQNQTSTTNAGSGSTWGNAAGGALAGYGVTGSPWGAALGGLAGLLK